MRTLILLLLALPAFAGEPRHLIVLHTNDVHGQLRPHPPSPVRAVLRGRPAGGVAHLATMVREIRREAERDKASLLLLDAGDIFQGTPIGNETRGDAVIECMHAMGYDAMALGNHEFDYGIPNLLRLVESARFPVLAANMTAADVGAVKPYVVIEPPRAPCRIALIGLISTDTPMMTSPVVGARFRFADPVETTRSVIERVKADLYIAVSHCGRDADKKLAEAVPRLALIASGHSHTPLNLRVNGVLILQTHAKALSLGRADLTLDPDGWKVLEAKGALLPVDPQKSAADPDVAKVIGKYSKELEKRMSVVVGRLETPARRAGGLGSSPAGNWVADVIRRVGKAEVGITNKGGMRCDLEAGDVTMGDVYRLMPFENSVVSMLLSGAQLRELVQRHIDMGRAGGHPCLEWSGMVVEIDERMVPTLLVDGKEVQDKQAYRVATNSFLSWGGDGYVTFREGRDRKASGVSLRDALADDLRRNSPVRPPAEARYRTNR